MWFFKKKISLREATVSLVHFVALMAAGDHDLRNNIAVKSSDPEMDFQRAGRELAIFGSYAASLPLKWSVSFRRYDEIDGIILRALGDLPDSLPGDVLRDRWSMYATALPITGVGSVADNIAAIKSIGGVFCRATQVHDDELGDYLSSYFAGLLGAAKNYLDDYKVV